MPAIAKSLDQLSIVMSLFELNLSNDVLTATAINNKTLAAIQNDITQFSVNIEVNIH